MLDFVLNQQPHGSIATRLMECDFDPGVLRPYVGDDRRSYITVNDGRGPDLKPKFKTLVTNAPATLRKDEWILLDRTVIQVARQRLKAFADLRARGLSYTVPNGMGKTVIQYQSVSDITDATISMDGLRQSEEDRPVYDIKNLPLPVIHKDFTFTAREIAVSREGGSPLDTTTAELAARKVAEEVEKLTLGVSPSYTYGGGTVYGYTNVPERITSVSLTNPTSGAWTGATLVGEILDMVQALYDANYFGPFFLYLSLPLARYLEDDYSTAKGDNTVRQRLAAIANITSVQTLDYLTGYQAILVQASSDVVRAVTGMEVTTLQWETHGGMRLHFKVMCIMVPQIRTSFEEATGIAHATV